MRSIKRLLILPVMLCIILAVIHILNGGSIAVGSWRDIPIQSLIDRTDYIEYTELKTVYLGDEGKDGAIVFYIEYDPEYDRTIFNMGYFRAKRSSSGYQYTYDSSFTYNKEILDSGIDPSNFFYNADKMPYLITMTTLTDNEIKENYPDLPDITTEPIEFELEGEAFFLNCVSIDYETKKEAESIIEYCWFR